MYPRIPWKLVTDSLGSADHNFGSTAIRHYYIFRKFMIKRQILGIFMFLEITLIGKTKAVQETGCQEECSSLNPQFPKKALVFLTAVFFKTPIHALGKGLLLHSKYVKYRLFFSNIRQYLWGQNLQKCN